MSATPPTSVKLGDYTARVLVEGQEVGHYKADVDEEKKVATCWIASEAEKVR